MPDFTLARKSASKIFRIIDRQSAIDAESCSGIVPLNVNICSLLYADGKTNYVRDGAKDYLDLGASC